MGSAQEQYHEGADTVRKALHRQLHEAATARAETEAFQVLVGEAQDLFGQFVAALGAVATHHRQKVLPAHAAAQRQAVEAQRAFEATLPNLTAPRVADTYDALEGLNSQCAAGGLALADIGSRAIDAAATAHAFGADTMEPVLTGSQPLLTYYDRIIARNREADALLAQQITVT